MKSISTPCFLHDMEYRRHLLLWAFLFFISPLFAQTPIAHYRLDGNANDAGSNGLNGTIVGALSPV
ncbi:MAG TPA: hypothetical protein PKY12_16170, partial [Catalimonadaceae bacterium]|nr:hypothetical protein [Catalimonadaceae bacterium]